MRTIYTAITGDYDDLLPVPTISENFIAFKENCEQQNGWDVKSLMYENVNPIRQSRWHKVFPYECLPDTEYSLWIDGNIIPTDEFNMQLLIDKHLKNTDIAVCKHRFRDCVYDEALAVMHYQFDYPEIVREQMNRYQNDKYQKNNGLAETMIVLRKHTNIVKLHSKLWWSEIDKGSCRDQLSFNYVCNQVGIKYSTFEPEDIKMFKMHEHSKPRAIFNTNIIG